MIDRVALNHNDANDCFLAARFIVDVEAVDIVDGFLGDSYEGGRHQRKVDKIAIE